jgi:hypothetical protein
VLAQGTPPLKRKVWNLSRLHGGKREKEDYFCFYKNKGYRYKDELGSKKNSNSSLTAALESLLVFLNANKKILQACGITVVASTWKYLGYHIFHRERRYFF